MSRRKKTPDQKSDQAARGAAARRRVPAPLPEVLLARRPATSPPPAAPEPEAAPAPVPDAAAETDGPSKGKRAARMVSAPKALEGNELERADLLSRVLDSNGSGPITRAVNAYRKRGFEFPEEQPIQLKLLEHADETVICGALTVLAALLDVEAPIQLPIFEQRLKRLEEDAESADTRKQAADLRRALRT